MADEEADPGCGPVLKTSSSQHEQMLPYPTNTFNPPSHIPGKKGNAPSFEAPSIPQIDYSKFDIIKASQYGVLERCRQLVEEEGVDVRVPDAENVTVLHWASINNKIPVMEYFISRGAIVDQKGGNLNATPLHWAIRQGHIDAIICLMKNGSDPSLEDSEGCSGLHLAAQFGHTSVVAYLLAKGMDVDLIDRNGMTPLMWAAYRSFGVDTMRVLVNFGASINYADKIHKNTALHWAIASSNTNSIKPLLRSGASLDQLNEQGLSPVDLAAERKNKWISHQLQEALTKRGGGRVSFFKRLTTDRDKKKKMGMIIPVVAMFSAGFILEYSSWWIYTVTLMAGLGVALNLSLRSFRDMEDNTVALGTYIATKMFMFSTLFLYFWPFVSNKVLILFTMNSTGLFYFFFKCWLSDPGIIHSKPSQQKVEIIQAAESGMLKDFNKFCATCLVRRPIRSKHCAICNKCVARMDHHCPWIDNCVGYKNHAYFFWYIFFLFGMNIWFQWAAVTYFNIHCGPFDKGIPISLISICSCAPWVTWGYGHALFHGLWVGALFVCNCYQLFWLGMTTNERMNSGRYRHFNDAQTGKIQSPFTRGVLQNMAEFFEFSFFGLVKRVKVDWMNQYELSSFTSDHPRGDKRYHDIV